MKAKDRTIYEKQYDVWISCLFPRQTYKATQYVEGQPDEDKGVSHLDRVWAYSKREAVTKVLRQYRAAGMPL